MTRKQKILFYFIIVFLMVIVISPALMADGGNTTIDSFQTAKKFLEKEVYYDYKRTVYCDAEFNQDKKIKLPEGFHTEKYTSRAERVEWEHIVPAENFGRTFSEWRDGHPDCQNLKGESFKGRKCAEEINQKYRLMQADMYNLYPAIGAVNALRQNYNFTQFQEDTVNSFGSCEMKIQDKKAEPPARARGIIARAYLYFEDAYSRYKMSDTQRKLMTAWDKLYPVENWECTRTCRIEKIQGNQNNIVRQRCEKANLWNCP